jgi:hypothetical protein
LNTTREKQLYLQKYTSHKEARILNPIEKQYDGLQYKHTLRNVMVTSVRLLYPDGAMQFQKGNPYILDSCVVQEWLSHTLMLNSLIRHQE